MTTRPETIAVAGAGIGGLATALALARRGIRSKVFEHRSAFAEEGAGIQLGPNATKILHALGVLDALRGHGAEPDSLSVHDGRSGHVLTRFPLGAWLQQRHGAPYLTIHRQDLHRELLAAALADPLIELSMGDGVTGFQHTEAGVGVGLSMGGTFTAQALVAADGLWSSLRTDVVPSASSPVPFGKCAYRTVVSNDALPSALAANDVHIWLAAGAHAVHYPVRNGDEHAIVVIVDGQGTLQSWNSFAMRDVLMASAAKDFAAVLRDMIFSAHNWRMWPLQTMHPLARWTDGAVALLGDAAHPVLPFFAQGGGLALEDAAVLAAHVAEAETPMPARLEAYAADRRARADRVIEASRTNGRIYHLSGPAAMARNAVLSAVPGAVLMRRYDWLYGWTP